MKNKKRSKNKLNELAHFNPIIPIIALSFML